MDPSSLNSQVGTIGSALAADSRSLEQLKRAAGQDPRQAVKKVATQFEALFMQMVLKSMRDATMRSGMLDSQEQDLYRGMLDQQVAQQVAASGTGLADLIARQLSRNLPASAPGGTTAGEPAAAASVSTPAGTGTGPTVAPPQPADAARAMQRSFMRQHWPDALQAQQLTGVPAGFILAQAALESGWGSREIRASDGAPSYNLFGIKAGANWQGRTVQANTTEVVGGVVQKTVQSFRAYDNYAAAFHDWALTIGRNQRYAGAVAPADGAGGFAAGMQQAGYSTDPAYGDKLARVIRTASSLGVTG